MRRSCKEIPVRIWIIVLIFTTRFLMTSIARIMTFCWKYMIESSHDLRYKPWCLLTSQQRLEAARIPWYNQSTDSKGPRHNLAAQHRIYIREAQFYGQMISSVPGGILTEYIGSFYVLLYTTSMAAILNVGRATITGVYWKNIVVVEFVLGIHLGLVYPAMYSWIARWAPPNERGVFVSSHVGNGFGNSLTRVFVRYMIPLVGWEWVLYTFTMLTILHLIPLWILGSNNPEDHKRMSAQELLYIKRSQRGRVTSTRSFPPFGNILSSGAFWSVNILGFGASCSHYYFIYEIADFLYNFMGIQREVVEIIEIFPHIGFCAVAITAALLGDYARTKKLVDDTTMIKINILFSHLGPGCILLFMGITHCNEHVAIVLLFVGYASSGCCMISCYRTTIDISPNYAGTVYGLVHVSGSLVKIIFPRLTKQISMISSELISWTIIFLVGGGCMVGTGVIFLFFGTANTQWWNLKSQDIYKLYHYKKPEERPSLEGEGNIADDPRIQNDQQRNNLLDKGKDDTEEWKSVKGKMPPVSGAGPSQPKTISSRASDYKIMNDSDSDSEIFEDASRTKWENLPETEHKHVSRTDVRSHPNNTLPIISGNILYSSEYLKGFTELGGKRTSKSKTTMLHETHTDFQLWNFQKLYGTAQKALNHFDQLLQRRSKSCPDLRWMNHDETGIRNKYEHAKVLKSA